MTRPLRTTLPRILSYTALIMAALICGSAYAMSSETGTRLDLTATGFGYAALGIFILAYALVISEEFLQLRKSKPVMVAAGIIWVVIGIAYLQLSGDTQPAAQSLREVLLEYAELLLFLLAAMTYINTMQERHVFEALRAYLVSSGYSLRLIYWLCGALAFFISPVADNMTTALVMGAVAVAVGMGNPVFISVSCISIVVAANAGGAFSPFGDITTLMVWQKGVVKFSEFFALFIPAVVNWLVPAVLMSLVIPKEQPKSVKETVHVKPGGYVIIGLFILTIIMTVSFHNFFHFPPVLGMMTGLGLLKVYSYYLKKIETYPVSSLETVESNRRGFDIYKTMERTEWDTLLFFYGVVLCVGGLGTLGYLALASEQLYGGLGPTWANIAIGLLSAVVDNIPVMYAVLTMNPDMSHGQWLLVTLTAGVGGSLLSIGSAAGVALMGQARGIYTFFSHLKWTWAIALGYAASIWVHLILNQSLMH